MIRLILNVALKRFAEFLCSCIILSALVSLLCMLNILPDGSFELMICLYAAAALFIFINIRMMRRCYYELRNTARYLVSNYMAYFAFGLLSVCVYKLFSGVIYTWLFAITKFAKYTNLYLSTKEAAAIFHLIMGVVISIAPMGMAWVHRLEEERFVTKEMVPPRMEEVIPVSNNTNQTEVRPDEGNQAEENPLP